MGQAYNMILRQSTAFTRSKLKSLKGWEAMSESSDLIALMKGIKGLIFRYYDTGYFYMGMRLDLCGFLNLHQGGMTVPEYHEQWTANKELAEEFGYKFEESDQATDRECEASGIKTLDTDYNKKSADASKVTREKFLADIFLLGADIRQYGRMITHLRNNYVKGQQNYPETVQKVQALLMAWEGEKDPVHVCNEGLSFANVVNDDDGDGGDDGDGDAQASGGRPSRGGATETHRCYY